MKPQQHDPQFKLCKPLETTTDRHNKLAQAVMLSICVLEMSTQISVGTLTIPVCFVVILSSEVLPSTSLTSHYSLIILLVTTVLSEFHRC